MKLKIIQEIENASNKYPDFSYLDLHYFGMCSYGIQDNETLLGRPSINLIDEKNLYHITFTLSNNESPYILTEDKRILFNNTPLPFTTTFVERIPVKTRRYYYLRGSRYMTPTINDETILNLNFQHLCFQCDYCQNLVCGANKNITPKEGFELILSRGDLFSLEDISEITICTGCFNSEENAVEHVKEVIKISSENGFRGRLFYMGYEISSEKAIGGLLKEIEKYKLSGLKIVYTVEMFENRSKFMKGKKGNLDIENIIKTLNRLSKTELYELQYSYIPGFDNLDTFKFFAERLRYLATPHISIYRSFNETTKENQVSEDYKQLGIAYLCEIKRFILDLYGEPILGNNLRNIFPFGLSQISEKWINNKILGETQHLRYWENERRPLGWREKH